MLIAIYCPPFTEEGRRYRKALSICVQTDDGDILFLNILHTAAEVIEVMETLSLFLNHIVILSFSLAKFSKCNLSQMAASSIWLRCFFLMKHSKQFLYFFIEMHSCWAILRVPWLSCLRALLCNDRLGGNSSWPRELLERSHVSSWHQRWQSGMFHFGLWVCRHKDVPLPLDDRHSNSWVIPGPPSNKIHCRRPSMAVRWEKLLTQPNTPFRGKINVIMIISQLHHIRPKPTWWLSWWKQTREESDFWF